MSRLNQSICQFFLVITIAGCDHQQDKIQECVGTQIKGWNQLFLAEPFASMEHRKQTQFDPLTGTSALSFSDASYVYDRMLTYTQSYPKGSTNQFSHTNSCISEISLIVRQPGTELSTDTLFVFLNFLEERGVPERIMLNVKAANETPSEFAVIGNALGAEVGAGFIEHVRGGFFVIRIKSLKPFMQPSR
jgi:hypothetical protein